MVRPEGQANRTLTLLHRPLRQFALVCCAFHLFSSDSLINFSPSISSERIRLWQGLSFCKSFSCAAWLISSIWTSGLKRWDFKPKMRGLVIKTGKRLACNGASWRANPLLSVVTLAYHFLGPRLNFQALGSRCMSVTKNFSRKIPRIM